MGVVRGEGGSDLVIAHDRQVDQKAEDPCAEEVPEAHRDEEHHHPTVKERLVRSLPLTRSDPEKGPRLDGEERERKNLRGGEEGAEGHMLDRRAREVEMVHRT